MWFKYGWFLHILLPHTHTISHTSMYTYYSTLSHLRCLPLLVVLLSFSIHINTQFQQIINPVCCKNQAFYTRRVAFLFRATNKKIRREYGVMVSKQLNRRWDDGKERMRLKIEAHCFIFFNKSIIINLKPNPSYNVAEMCYFFGSLSDPSISIQMPPLFSLICLRLIHDFAFFFFFAVYSIYIKFYN